MKKSGSAEEKPVVGITMGDPSGVGPEIIVKALGGRKVGALCRPVVIGRGDIMKEAAARWKPGLSFDTVQSLPPRSRRGCIPLFDTGPDSTPVPLGRPGKAGGRAAIAAIEKGAALALEGTTDAVVTAPISKESIKKAGSPFPGHTEMLASLTGSRRFAMMLVGGPLKVSLATIHMPLRDVPGSLRTASIRTVIELTWEALSDFGEPQSAIAVCGLNPHAGEAGIMGDEDRLIVAPAIRAASKKGIPVSGPWPADTIFYRAARGEFGAVVAMYHDQGLAPLKTLAFDSGVNITLGLPIVRTSVDHGTAYDIAGRGEASPASMISAVEIAARLAASRRRKKRR